MLILQLLDSIISSYHGIYDRGALSFLKKKAVHEKFSPLSLALLAIGLTYRQQKTQELSGLYSLVY